MPPSEPPTPRRESMLTVILTGMVGLFALSLLLLIGGTWVAWLVVVVGGLAFFALFHYLLWGKLLSDQTAGEREEEEAAPACRGAGLRLLEVGLFAPRWRVGLVWQTNPTRQRGANRPTSKRCPALVISVRLGRSTAHEGIEQMPLRC